MRVIANRTGATGVASPARRWGLAVALFGLAVMAMSAAPTAQGADKIYWGNLFGNTISYANLDGSGGGELPIDPAALDGPMGLAIDSAAGKIYWSNYGNSVGGSGTTISVANLDGSDAHVLPITPGLVLGPHGVAIDPATGKLYWTNHDDNPPNNSWIGYANLDGSNAAIFNNGSADMEGPRGLALDPATGKLYWANFFGGRISFAKLDGSGGDNLNTAGATVENPEGVALDPPANRLYFGDFNTVDKIASINLDGSGGADLDTSPIMSNQPHGVALDVAANRIYWPNFGDNTISYANLTGGGGAYLPISGTTPNGPDQPVLLQSPVGAGAPAIKGPAAPGSTLHCTNGAWADERVSLDYRSPASYSYQWIQGSQPIAGATSVSIHAPAVADYRCQVTASNAAGSESQSSRTYGVFKIGREKLNRRKGTARLKVRVPAQGKLTLGGKGVVKQRLAGSARPSRVLTRKVGAGKVKLVIKAKGKAKKGLERRGKAKVRVTVTFTPRGGTSSEQVKRLKLKEKLRP